MVSWFNAYHRPGRLTTGLDIWVEEQRFSNHNRAFKARLRLTGQPRKVTVLLNMQPGSQYMALWNGQLVSFKEINPGSFEIGIPFEAPVGELEFDPID